MMTKKFGFSILFFLLTLQIIAGACEARADSGVLTLDAAIAEVLAANPDIRAAEERTLAAKARIPQAKALDDPMVGVEFYNVPIDTINVNRSDDIDYKISQNIPFPGKRHVRGKIARLDADVAAGSTEGSIQDILLDLKRTYYDIYRLDRLLGVNGENQRLFQQLLNSAETSYATGKTGADVPLKTQVELSQLKNEEISLKQERVTHMSHLKALLNRGSHEEIRLPQNLRRLRLKVDLANLQHLAQNHRPELAMLDAMSKREKSKVTEAKQTWLPDFTFGLAYKQKPIGQDVWAAETAINLPIFFGKNRATVQEAKAYKRAADAEQQSMRLHTRHEIDQTYEGVRALQQLIASYESGILPQAKTNLAAAETAYASGHADFSTLIEAAKTYKDLKGSYYETQAQLGMSVAELERMIGQSLTLTKEKP